VLLASAVLLGFTAISGSVCAQATSAQTPVPTTEAQKKPDLAKDDSAARYAAFDQLMSGSVLEGRFSVDGQEGELKQERYEIADVSKIPGGDLWLFKTRIRYGDHDVTVPLPLPVIWAGDTPVIVVNQVAIPGMGTFDANVVIAGERYAGTWQHGEVGGHLFGRIIAPTKKSKPDAEANEADGETKSDADVQE
jgi:hypothetical protein